MQNFVSTQTRTSLKKSDVSWPDSLETLQRVSIPLDAQKQHREAGVRRIWLDPVEADLDGP